MNKLTQAYNKLNGKFPMHLSCFYYKGFRCTRDMFRRTKEQADGV